VDNPKTESSKCENVKSLRGIVLLETTSVFNLNSLSRIRDGPLQCLQHGPVVRRVSTYIHLWQRMCREAKRSVVLLIYYELPGH